MKKNYETPKVKVVQVEVENGFAFSKCHVDYEDWNIEIEDSEGIELKGFGKDGDGSAW